MYKGQFYEAHEGIIGRDLLLFRLERVQRVNEKARPLDSQMIQLELDISSDAQNVARLKAEYESAELGVCKLKSKATTEIFKAINTLVKQM